MIEPRTKRLLTTFLRRLTNLSGTNRSILLPRLLAEQHIDLQELSFLNGKKSFSIIENLIAGKSSVVASELDSRLEANNLVSRKLKKLRRLDQFLYDERGTKDLHVGWPFVRGRFIDGTLARCPLLYFPVELVLENGQWLLHPRSNAPVGYNKSFLLAYSFYNQTQPANDALEEDFDEAESDSAVFRTFVYQSLQKNNLEIHFNPDNYRDELVAFQAFTREELEAVTEVGRLKLHPEAVLGIFPQAGSSLVPDYLQLIEEEKVADLEELFAKAKATVTQPADFQREVREEKMYTVFPLDAWQETAIKGVKLGNSLVVQGPPGTGKSQLISNLITDMIAHHRRVLLVCQKRVALDVVYERLKEKRLDEFTALVHDFREDRKELYQKINRQIERLDEYRAKNNSLDAIHLERRFYDVSRRIDQLTEELESFRNYLFDESECGVSVKQLYLQSQSGGAAIELKQELAHFKWNESQEFRRKLKQYVRLAARFRQPEHPWYHRKSFSGHQVHDLIRIRETVQAVFPWWTAFIEKLNTRLSYSFDWERCDELLESGHRFEEIKALLSDHDIYTHFQRMAGEADEDTSLLWLSNMEKVVVECFHDEGPELTISSSQLGQFQVALYRSMKARKSLFGLIRWELFSTDKFLIKRTLVANQLINNKIGFQTLERKLDRRLNLEHNLSKLRAVSWIPEPPLFQNELEAKRWFASLQFAVQAKLLFRSFRGIHHFFKPALYQYHEFIDTGHQLFQWLSEFRIQRENWSNYLSVPQLRELTRVEEMTKTLATSLAEDFDALCTFDSLQENLAPHERTVIGKLVDAVGYWNETQIDLLFVNSVALAWIDHIEMKHPELRMVSNGRMEEMEDELRDLLTEKESISSEIVLMRAREGVVDDLEFNRLNNRVTYRDLQHQLTKKKKVWPIRKIVSEFENDLFRVMPCWMASPESVSSIFPMVELFDLVIFDEASQCFAERGIPALYRGKQCLIAGDPQQLQPSDLYLTRWEDDSEEPEAELSSLLDLGSRFLSRLLLQGHYRSRSPQLISFSNQHFYGGKLMLLPDCRHLNDPEPSIVVDRVPGIWKDNTNLAEAQRVVAKVVEWSSNSDKEIGIITFNTPQQSLILDLLDQEEADTTWKRPSSLFVKNIENVQGDERDIIVFSIGYAPDEKGKLTAQFGSLNVAGGENRLNVAVTRAREKILIVTSISANDLQVDDTRNDGPKLLRGYLRHAEDVSRGHLGAEGNTQPQHGSTWYLKNQIKTEMEQRFQVDARFSFAEFLFRREELYFGLLRTDDDTYFQSPSAKASHGLWPRLLQEKNWKQKMIYSRNFWMNSEKFWNEVGKFASS